MLLTMNGFARTASLIAALCLPVLGSSPAPADANIVGGMGPLAPPADLSVSRLPEQTLVTALEKLSERRVREAQVLLRDLVEETPDFRLAQLVYADLLAARSGGFQSSGAGRVPESMLLGLEDEARRRWLHHRRAPNGNRVPESIVKLDSGQRVVLVVDLELSRLYVLENSEAGLRILEDYYVSGGLNGAVKWREGDRRTPVGVYFTQEHIPGRRLPSEYGWGAFTLDYPNAWDLRLQRTGHGIWIHGNPTGDFSRPPQASDGCVTMHNDDLAALAPLLLSSQIPVVIKNQVTWVEREHVDLTRVEVLERIDQWRDDWASLDTDAYLGHYSDAFRNRQYDFNSWSRHKRTVNGRKTEIRVSLEDVNVFLYPEGDDLFLVTFRQNYWSDNFASNSRKRQFWQREADGALRIIYEGSY
jgi:murein L,D-transpeptidase YafK